MAYDCWCCVILVMNMNLTNPILQNKDKQKREEWFKVLVLGESQYIKQYGGSVGK